MSRLTESATAPRNRLGAETSPYLLQHAANPVDWYPWGPEALERAKAEGRPIMLSIGYAACHWCHVMAHESFEDDTIAAEMNRLYVNIKVDREERPDLDQIYQSALALMGERGGWPLTMFLTPEGEPFWGGTYFPPTSRWGRPGFSEVLRAVARTYAEQPDKIKANVVALKHGLEGLSAGAGGAMPTLATLTRVAEGVARMIDPIDGGLQGAPKFPQCGLLELLWRAWRRTRREPFRTAVLASLTAMAEGGIYDHVGGGFARYSTDERWLVPHFEKMLYDNAELIGLMTAVWTETRDPLYARRIDETIRWLQREMMNGDGFASALDADSEGEEGRFYVWTAAEIEEVLGPDAGAFGGVYDVSADGNWEGHVILNRRGQRPTAAALAGTEPDQAMLTRCLARLLERRTGRVRPQRDDKVLADWNGLMISALADAAGVFGRPDWLDLATRAYRFVTGQMIGADGRLLHSYCAGRARHPATLDDHASMARAALALHAATGDAGFVADAEQLVRQAEQRFADTERGGYFTSASDTLDVIVRARSATDHATPSGNGMMAEVLTRLWLLTGETRYRDAAEAVFSAFCGDLGRTAVGAGALLNAADLFLDGAQLVIQGEPDDPSTQALVAAAAGLSRQSLVVQRVRPGAALPADHPAAGKGLVGGRATAYLCRGPVCQPPITDPAALAQALKAEMP